MKKRIILTIFILGLIILGIGIFLLTRKNEYTVTFITNSDTEIREQKIRKNDYASKPNDPIKDGYEFSGWYLDNFLFDFTTKITENITLTAKWNKITVNDDEIIVKFDTDGGNSISSLKIKKGEKIEKPKEPTKEGYKFIGWYLDDEEYDFESEVNENLMLTAKWKKELTKYVVTFDTDGGSAITKKMVEEGKSVVRPNNPTKSGYSFKEWQLDRKTYNFNTKVTKDIILKAIWEKLVFYKVVFDSDGGTKVNDLEVGRNKTVAKPNDPTKSGYKFVGWYLGNNEYNFNTKVTGNITLKAKWEKYYSVSFDLNGGTGNFNTVNVVAGSKLEKPNDPTRTGYTFTGWTLNGSSYDFNKTVNSDIKLTANWKINSYTVKFDTDGATNINDQIIKYKEKVIKPNDPTKIGYTFTGWTLNGSSYDFNREVTENIILKANFKKDSYTIQAVRVDKFSVDYKLSVYKNGTQISFTEIRNSNGSKLCTYANPTVYMGDIKDVTTLKVIIDGNSYDATITIKES